MSANPQTTTRVVYNHILSLLEGLPPASLVVAERFVEFLHEQARQGQPVITIPEQVAKSPYFHPTVAVPASSLDGWLKLVPEGYEGNALADTEAIYDETQS